MYWCRAFLYHQPLNLEYKRISNLIVIVRASYTRRIGRLWRCSTFNHQPSCQQEFHQYHFERAETAVSVPSPKSAFSGVYFKSGGFRDCSTLHSITDSSCTSNQEHSSFAVLPGTVLLPAAESSQQQDFSQLGSLLNTYLRLRVSTKLYYTSTSQLLLGAVPLPPSNFNEQQSFWVAISRIASISQNFISLCLEYPNLATHSRTVLLPRISCS